MRNGSGGFTAIGGIALVLLTSVWLRQARAELPFPLWYPEQRSTTVRDPSELSHIPLPLSEAPPTVTHPRFDAPPLNLSLDEAIYQALINAEVVRVLAGVTAVSSGRTIYDAPITGTAIESQKARFDPVLNVNNGWNRFESANTTLFEGPGDPPGVPLHTRIDGLRTDNYALDFELSKTLLSGGQLALGYDENNNRFQPGLFPLNPRYGSSIDLSFTQPLLQGGGWAVNRVPIVLARIDTERSYFQFKGSVQDMVHGAIQAYWALVLARTELWTRRQQVEQTQWAFEMTSAKRRFNMLSGADVAQTRLALANFKASLVTAEANVLQREAALRNLLGLPPYDPMRVTPITPPTKERLPVDWHEALALAEQYRPDLIELKLILEADQQQLLQARNLALPRVDAVALYRWNGLEGIMPVGESVSSPLGSNTDWTLGVNFSVPLGLRQSRAQLRQRELLIARDRANLDQGMHNAVHRLALTTRNLDQFYEQYLAFRETRAAARVNLEQQMGRYSADITIYLNVLQAIADWGNSVSSEAASLAQYNTELASLERETGTILETHGIRLFEERYGSIGPLGRVARDQHYPKAIRPSPGHPVYPVGEQPSEQFFDLEDPLKRLEAIRRRQREQLPPPTPLSTIETPSTLQLPNLEQPGSILPGKK
ncbi:MAG: TolC family protein [Planctomycetes bacterium]|nr:TolC family protein [Planctomycetota bacterium]